MDIFVTDIQHYTSTMKNLFILLLSFTVFLTGCKKDDSPTSDNSTPTTPTTVGTYSGTLAGSNGVSGALSISIAQNAQQTSSVPTALVTSTYTVTGSLVINGNIIVLTGTFDGTTINISGANFTLAGTLSNGTLSGSFIGPNGATGSFTVSKGTNGATVKVYTGTISGSTTGTFNIVVNGSTITGVAVTGSAHQLTGTVTGNSISINGGTAVGSFTNNGNNCSGTWNDGQGGSGTWQGTLVDISNIKVYAGTVTGSGGSINGVLRVSVNGSTVGAVITGVASNPIVLKGTVSGNDIKLVDDNSTEVASGTFTNNGNNCSGTWDNHQGATGTWQAALVTP